VSGLLVKGMLEATVKPEKDVAQLESSKKGSSSIFHASRKPLAPKGSRTSPLQSYLGTIKSYKRLPIGGLRKKKR